MVPPGCLFDHSSNSSELLQSSESASMETQRLRSRAYEVFKTLNDLNPNFMKEIFYRSSNIKSNAQMRQFFLFIPKS